MFYWKRIVIDEIHELIQSEDFFYAATAYVTNITNLDQQPLQQTTSSSSNTHRAWTLPIKCLRSYIRWGLTGTPPTTNLRSIDNLSSLLGVTLGTGDVTAAKNFIDTFISSSRRTECSYPTPVEHYIHVKLSLDEMILYKQCKFDHSEQLRVGNIQQLSAYETLLQSCSHFSLGVHKRNNNSNSNSHVNNAESEMDRLKMRKEQDLKALQDKLDIHSLAYDRYVSQIRILDQDDSMREDDRRNKVVKILGKKEEELDICNTLKEQIKTIKRSLDYFMQTIQDIREGSKLPECM